MTGDSARVLAQTPQVLKRLAKCMALQCFRNTVLEDFHAGTSPHSPAGDYSDVVVKTPVGDIPWRVTHGSATFGSWTLIDSQLGERSPVFPDDADLLSMEPGKLYCHTEQLVLLILIIRCKRVLMKDHHFCNLTTRLGEVRQQLLDCF